MGTATNRMKRVPFTVPTATETIVVGNGREGVLNGADKAEFVVDMKSGLFKMAATARIYLQATRGGEWAMNTTTYSLAHGGTRRLDLLDLAGYAVKITITHTEGADRVFPCEWQSHRGA